MASPSKAPRKAPTQERAKETVRTLLDATLRCIERKSAAELSVAEVASTAGFGVATLYQYFPTKDALIAACEERELARLVETFTARATTLYETRARLDDALPELVCLVLELFHPHATRFTPPTGEEFFSRKAERWELLDRLAALVAGMLAVRAEDYARLRDKDLRLASQLVVQAVGTLGYMGWVRHGNETNIAAYQREVAAMVTRYLLGSSGPATPPAA